MAFYPTVLSTTNNTTVRTAFQGESIISKTPIGSMPAGLSTITCVEYSTGRDIVVYLTLNNFVVGALAGAAAALAMGNIIYTLPAGAQFTTVAYKNISLTAVGTAVAVDLGIGSIVGTGAQSVLSGVGATAEDYLTGVATTTGASGGTAVAQMVAVTATIATNVAASVKDIFLNGAATWNANNTGNLTATGNISFKYSLMS
jgi:hypothetical protein